MVRREFRPYIRRVNKIGRYRIDEELGRGAGGTVYLAHHPDLDGPVAVTACDLPDRLDPAVWERGDGKGCTIFAAGECALPQRIALRIQPQHPGIACDPVLG